MGGPRDKRPADPDDTADQSPSKDPDRSRAGRGEAAPGDDRHGRPTDGQTDPDPLDDGWEPI